MLDRNSSAVYRGIEKMVSKNIKQEKAQCVLHSAQRKETEPPDTVMPNETRKRHEARKKIKQPSTV